MHLLQLLLQIGSILLVGRVLARGLRRLGQPAVIAEIVAGIALGPSVLGAAWPEGMGLLFPADSLPHLGTVAQLGLVFFMFLVGLEFDPRLLQGQVRASVRISNAGILVPLASGAALGVPLHPLLAPEGVGLGAFSLFLGTAMSVTAFPVLARILTERRLMRTPVGSLALASAAVDDVSAWCLLALVVGVVTSGDVVGAGVTTLMALAYSAAVWFLVRPILARLGPRGGGGVSTDVVAVIFLLVFASAATTEWIGVHALFGSFLIGAAMPREGGLGPALAEKMEDFVTVALLPLFFAYSGLRTRIGLLDDPSDWALCALIVAVACAGKFGGTAIVARLSGLGWRDSSAVGVLMNTRGLMELVMLNVGLDLGVISERLFAMMVIMALVTTWITSPLLAWLYPERGERPAAPTPAPPLAQPGVLLCVSDPAVARSLVHLARAWVGAGPGRVWALHLKSTDRPRDYLRDGAATPDEPLQAVERAARGVGLLYEPVSFPSADPGADILNVAAANGHPLVVLGVHRSTLGRDTLGGVAGRVLDGAEGDVAVLLDRGLEPMKTYALRAGGEAAGAERLAARLEASGVRRVERAEEADLVVAAWAPDAELPTDDGPSWLLVRGRR